MLETEKEAVILFDKYKQRKAELEAERKLLKESISEAKKLHKDITNLKNTIEAYHRQGALLLLEDLDIDLVKKLQSLTDDNIIVIFSKDGTRMEIKSTETNYKRENGQIR